MQPHQAHPPYGQPQQGYPPPGFPPPFGAPARLRANAAGSVLTGVLGLLTAGLLVWFALANMVENDTQEPWPELVRTNVIGGFTAAGVLVILGVVIFARTVAGAWTLSVVSLFFVIANLIAPLLRGDDFGEHLDFVFGFHKTTGVAIGLTTIAGVLTAIAAAVAAIAKQPARVRLNPSHTPPA